MFRPAWTHLGTMTAATMALIALPLGVEALRRRPAEESQPA